jgi:hypothetical protein
MKNIYYCLMAGLMALVMMSGCKKDKELNHTEVSAVSNFFAPADNKYVKVVSGGTGSVLFEWEQARAEDNGLVYYEVAFDKVGGVVI